ILHEDAAGSRIAYVQDQVHRDGGALRAFEFLDDDPGQADLGGKVGASCRGWPPEKAQHIQVVRNMVIRLELAFDLLAITILIAILEDFNQPFLYPGLIQKPMDLAWAECKPEGGLRVQVF